MNSPKYILQNMLISYVQTKNVVLNYILNFFLISLLTYIFQNTSIFISFFINTFKFLMKKDYVEIIIESSHGTKFEKDGLRTGKMIYSDAFKSVCFYIKNIQQNGVYSKREPDKYEKSNNPTFDFFIPDQFDEFILDNEKKIMCIMKMYKERLQDNENKNSIEKKEHYMRIFSKNKNATLSDLENFIKNCIVSYTEYKDLNMLQDQYFFNYLCSTEDNDLVYTENIFKSNKTFTSVFFEEKDKFLKKLHFFLDNKNWYIKKGIPYHFGIFLHGEPGCGKTSIIKATAKLTKKHIFNIHLNRVKTCGELYNIFFNEIVNDKKVPIEKRIYVFEDIDCLLDIIEDREDKEKRKINNNDAQINAEKSLLYDILSTEKKETKPEDNLNLGALLNVFDGLLECPGRIIFMTSNYPDRIDKALLRPGRIDLNIELKKCNHDIILDILSHFFDKDKQYILSLLNNNLFEDYKLTPSYIINICSQNNSLEESILEIQKCYSSLKK